MNDYIPYLTFLCLMVYQVKSNRSKRAKKLLSNIGGTTIGISPSKAFKSEKTIQNGELLHQDTVPQIYLHKLVSLSDNFESKNIGNSKRRLIARNDSKDFLANIQGLLDLESLTSCPEPVGYNKIINPNDYIISDIVRKQNSNKPSEAYIRAGPRATIHFNPKEVNAAIVTCGGLCPGLNNVIRELVHSLYYLYGCSSVLGIIGGYNGFNGDYRAVKLTPENVADCHHHGGTILASSRGGFDLEKILAFIDSHNINQLFIIGGDGTHRGAYRISQEVIKRGLNVAVAGIPKTIDNDVDLIDRSFGFQTSVEAAQAAILSAKTEARCNLPNGIGIVKLMGRSAGFISAFATLASGDVDLCIVPEVPMDLHGCNGYLDFILKRVEEQGHAVVVVAEGAGEEVLGESAEKDAGGNKKLPKIGEYLKSAIENHFKKKSKVATVKYIDPSYMIRSVPANASDSLYCMQLAQNAVHGTMAGYTGFSTGLVNNRMVYIPIPRLVESSPRVMDPNGRTWERVRAMTRQPQKNNLVDTSKV